MGSGSAAPGGAYVRNDDEIVSASLYFVIPDRTATAGRSRNPPAAPPP